MCLPITATFCLVQSDFFLLIRITLCRLAEDPLHFFPKRTGRRNIENERGNCCSEGVGVPEQLEGNDPRLVTPRLEAAKDCHCDKSAPRVTDRLPLLVDMILTDAISMSKRTVSNPRFVTGFVPLNKLSKI